MDLEYTGYLLIVFTGTVLLQHVFRISFLKRYRQVAWAILPVSLLFIGWDALAVFLGHWSFNPEFVLGVFIGNQPIEEITFFVVVPLFYLSIWEIAKTRVKP